jgi:hypothetical protein
MTMIIDGPRRREQLAAVAERLPAHVARLAWSADQIKAERQRALRETLALAKLNSPWHTAAWHRPSLLHSRRPTCKRCR